MCPHLLTLSSAMPADVSKAASEKQHPQRSLARGAPRLLGTPTTTEPQSTPLTQGRRTRHKRLLGLGARAATLKPAALWPLAAGMEPIRRFGDG